jgi:hypothetical protein
MQTPVIARSELGEFVDRFHDDGYGIIRGAVPQDAVPGLRSRLLQLLGPIQSGPGAPPPQRLLPRLVELDPMFTDLAVSPPLVATLTEVFGTVPHLVCTYGHEKPAGTAAHTGPHSDVAHLPGVPHHLSLLMVKAMVALTPVAAGGGATSVYPGTHQGAESGQGQAVELEPGDMVIFHANIRHTATANTAAVPRLSLWFTYTQPWMRVFPGYEFSAGFLRTLAPLLETRPGLRAMFGLTDPYATQPGR